MEEGQLDKAAAGAANLIASDGNGGSSPTEPTLPESGPGSKMEKPDSWTSDKVIPINDGTGTTIPLPDGFDYVGGRQKYRIGNFR